MNDIDIFKQIHEQIKSKRIEGKPIDVEAEYKVHKNLLSEFVKKYLSTTRKDKSKMYWRDYLLLLKAVRDDPNYLNDIQDVKRMGKCVRKYLYAILFIILIALLMVALTK